MKDHYAYPAIFYEGYDGLSIEFPDLPDCLPYVRTVKDAVKSAKEALQLYLYNLEKNGEPIPKPSKEFDVKPDDETGSVIMIDVWMPPLRNKMLKK